MPVPGPYEILDITNLPKAHNGQEQSLKDVLNAADLNGYDVVAPVGNLLILKKRIIAEAAQTRTLESDPPTAAQTRRAQTRKS